MSRIACARCDRVDDTKAMRKTYVGVYICEQDCRGNTSDGRVVTLDSIHTRKEHTP